MEIFVISIIIYISSVSIITMLLITLKKNNFFELIKLKGLDR